MPHDILPFLIQHWELSTAFVALLILVVLEERKTSVGGRFAVSPTAAVTLINREKAVVLDLRTADQFQAGHIVDALSVPFADLDTELKSLHKYQQRILLIVCPLNKSATLVMAKLRKAGFAKAQLIAGGVEAWKRAELPLIK